MCRLQGSFSYYQVWNIHGRLLGQWTRVRFRILFSKSYCRDCETTKQHNLWYSLMLSGRIYCVPLARVLAKKSNFSSLNLTAFYCTLHFRPSSAQFSIALEMLLVFLDKTHPSFWTLYTYSEQVKIVLERGERRGSKTKAKSKAAPKSKASKSSLSLVVSCGQPM